MIGNDSPLSRDKMTAKKSSKNKLYDWIIAKDLNFKMMMILKDDDFDDEQVK